MDNYKYSTLQGELLSSARYESGKSQEYMALSLGVSKNTIYNWEKGTSSPDIKQFIHWFEILGFNPTPYLLQFGSPDLMKGINNSDKDEKIETALLEMIKGMPTYMQKCLLYIFSGKHGSDPYSLMQMTIAYLHCGLQARVPLAYAVKANYEMCLQKNELIDPEHILPDLEVFNKAIKLSQEAVIKGERGYTNKRED